MRNSLILAFLMVLLAQVCYAQIQKPVTWSYGAKKLGMGVYEIHLLAKMDQGWHIYAQKQAKDAIAVPTSIVFEKMKGLVLMGPVMEKGKKVAHRIEALDVVNMEYAGQVDFVQKVRVSPGVKVLRARISFQACTNERCLPEETVEASIPLPQ